MERVVGSKPKSISSRAKLYVYIPTTLLLIVLNLPYYFRKPQILGLQTKIQAEVIPPTPIPTTYLAIEASAKLANSQPTTSPIPPTPTPVINPTSTTIPQPTPSPVPPTTKPTSPKYLGGTFTHPKYNYSLSIPQSWSGDMPSLSPNTLIIYSPDYQFTPDNSYGRLNSGAEFSIIVNPTTATNIYAIFESKMLSPQVAKNKVYTEVSGQPAIQYDYLLEGYSATMTEFINNNRHYAIKYRYADYGSKTEYWEIYLELLKSFKAS